MRLTNHIRDVFVRSVIQEIPEPDYEKVKKELQDALYAAMSADVRRVYRKTPQALRKWHTWELGDRRNHEFIVGDVDADAVAKPFLEFDRARREFKKKLTAAVRGFSTVKQVRDAYPELAHHLPSEDKPTANLPAASNLVAEMVKLGWEPKVQAK